MKQCALVPLVLLCAVACAEEPGKLVDPPPPVTMTCVLPEVGRLEMGHSDTLEVARTILADDGLLRGRDFTVAGVFAEHDTALPTPCCDGPLCLHAELSVIPDIETGAPIRVVRVGVNASDRSSEAVDVRRNVVVAVDLSASLRTPESTGLITKLLNDLIDGLHDDDQFALVTFRNQPLLDVPLATVGADRAPLHAAVGALEFGGATNLWGGLEGALFHAVSNFDRMRENRVILLTDGRPTWGVSNTEVVVDGTYDFVRRGVMLSIVGIGDDQIDTITRRVGTEADGEFFSIGNEADVEMFVTGQLASTWRAVATDLALEVTRTGAFDVAAMYGVHRSEWDGSRMRLERPVVLEAPDGRLRSPGHGVGGGSMITFELSGGTPANDPLFKARLTYERGAERYNESVEVEVGFDTATPKQDVYFESTEMEFATLVHDTAVRMFIAGVRADEGLLEVSLKKLRFTKARIEAYQVRRGDREDLTRTLGVIDDGITALEARGVVGAIEFSGEAWPELPAGSNR